MILIADVTFRFNMELRKLLEELLKEPVKHHEKCDDPWCTICKKEIKMEILNPYDTYYYGSDW